MTDVAEAKMRTSTTNENDDKIDDYVRTASGNYVSRRANLQGAHQVELKGRSIVESDVTLRGDLAPIRVGRYCCLGHGCRITPPPLTMNVPADSAAPSHAPVTIGAHTTVGRNCDIQVAAMGSYNKIGNDVTLGPRVVLKDAVVILDRTTVPADTVVPPFTLVHQQASSTAPCMQLEFIELSPATIPLLQDSALDLYHERVAQLTTSTTATKTSS